MGEALRGTMRASVQSGGAAVFAGALADDAAEALLEMAEVGEADRHRDLGDVGMPTMLRNRKPRCEGLTPAWRASWPNEIGSS
jgi:hypothetical protein